MCRVMHGYQNAGDIMLVDECEMQGNVGGNEVSVCGRKCVGDGGMINHGVLKRQFNVSTI